MPRLTLRGGAETNSFFFFPHLLILTVGDVGIYSLSTEIGHIEQLPPPKSRQTGAPPGGARWRSPGGERQSARGRAPDGLNVGLDDGKGCGVGGSRAQRPSEGIRFDWIGAGDLCIKLRLPCDPVFCGGKSTQQRETEPCGGRRLTSCLQPRATGSGGPTAPSLFSSFQPVLSPLWRIQSGLISCAAICWLLVLFPSCVVLLCRFCNCSLLCY